MIINRIGAKFVHEGVTYTIGGKVYANGRSEYEGLCGVILEIRDGDDRETENDTPDIYCEFMPPVLSDEIQAIEARFSELYGTPKQINDLGLDMVIMGPEMLQVLEPADAGQVLSLYIVKEEWAFQNECGEDFHLSTSPELAKHTFTSLIQEELTSGYLKEWAGRPDLELEQAPQYYECWLHDEYYENHYKVYIKEQKLPVNIDTLAVLGQLYIENLFRNQFAEQTRDWEELEELTQAQIAQMIASPEVPKRIRRQLEQNDGLVESYWESVSEAAFALVKKFKEGLQ